MELAAQQVETTSRQQHAQEPFDDANDAAGQCWEEPKPRIHQFQLQADKLAPLSRPKGALFSSEAGDCTTSCSGDDYLEAALEDVRHPQAAASNYNEAR